MAKLPGFDFRLQRSDAQPAEYSVEYVVREGALARLRVARAGGSETPGLGPAGEFRRLSGSELRASRFELSWDGGARRIAYGLQSLAPSDLDHLVPGTWYNLKPERRDGPRRLELARPEGSFGLSRLDPEDPPVEDSVTEEGPQAEVPGAVELALAKQLDEPVEPGPPSEQDERRLTLGGGLVGPTGGALVRHLRRKQARDAREIARLRVALKRLHKLLKEHGIDP